MWQAQPSRPLQGAIAVAALRQLRVRSAGGLSALSRIGPIERRQRCVLCLAAATPAGGSSKRSYTSKGGSGAGGGSGRGDSQPPALVGGGALTNSIKECRAPDEVRSLSA